MGLETKNDIRAFVMRELEMSVSEREWKFRLRGYGFGIRDTDKGRMITSLRSRHDLCALGASA